MVELKSTHEQSRRWHWLSLTALATVVVMIFGLMAYGFLSQKRLHESALLRLEENLAGRARAVDYFLTERKNDVRELAVSDVVSAYFENKSLAGLLMYGLEGNLESIKRKFQNLNEYSAPDLQILYTRLVLLSADGELLVEYLGSEPNPIVPGELQDIIGTPLDTVTVQQDRSNPDHLLFISAVKTGDAVDGYIAGWVSLVTIQEQFLDSTPGDTGPTGETISLFLHNKHFFPAMPDDFLPLDTLQNQLSWNPPGTRRQDVFSFSFDAGEGEEYLVSKRRLLEPDMMVFQMFEKDNVVDPKSPYRLLIGMLIVGSGVLGLSLMAIRQDIQAKVLVAELDESGRQQKTIRQMNEDLSREVRQRRVTESELSSEKERLELVVLATNIGTWEWDIQSGEMIINERWANIVGYTLIDLEPVTIKAWTSLLHPDDSMLWKLLMDKHFCREVDEYDLECRMRHKSGHWVWVHARGRVVDWASDGKPLRMSGIQTDISTRKETEIELHHAKLNLEKRVDERTRELAHAHSQLALQEKMASVGQLAAGLAHELNNPINFVRINFAALVDYFKDLIEMIEAYREMLAAVEKGDPQDEAAGLRELEQSLGLESLLEDVPELLDESERGFDRVGKIIQSMRDFSRSDNLADRVWFNLNKGIEDTLTIARNEYRYHATIEKDLGEVPDLYCNPEQLNQVFLNLIINASHALAEMKEGHEGIIRVSTRKDGNEVVCDIADNGPGISEDLRNRIFEPFFTTKDPGEGTGLGLSISYDIIVNKHRGEMTVQCPEEGGTVFTIRLPLRRDENSEAQ